jgi:hypothetical protein
VLAHHAWGQGFQLQHHKRKKERKKKKKKAKEIFSTAQS